MDGAVPVSIQPSGFSNGNQALFPRFSLFFVRKSERKATQVGNPDPPERSSRMETGEAPPPQSTCGSQKPRRARIEVFSAVLENEDLLEQHYKVVFGVVLLRSCNHNFPIFDSPVVGPPQVNPEGLLTLTFPKRSIPVEDEVLILPWFIIMFICAMNRRQHVLWKADMDAMDQFICRTIKCFLNIDLHVSFAVYRDPLEAHFDAYFIDLEYGEQNALLQVHGTMTASNSFLCDSKAKCILFQGGECVSLKANKSAPLTLSRRMTVIPRQSTLLVDVSIEVRMGPGEDPLSFTGRLEFNPSSDYGEEFVILPNYGKLLVKATWVECEDRLDL